MSWLVSSYTTPERNDVMKATTPAYLPLSSDKALILDIMANGGPVPSWASPQIVGRLRNEGLIQREGGTHTLTITGAVVGKIVTEHGYATGYAHPGRIGVKGRCRCGDWTWHTNEGGHDGKRRVRNAFAEHLAELIAAALSENS